MHVYKFRNCLLNTAERSVIKDRQHLELTTKTFDVLQYLIENAGKVVSKDELLGNVWNGNFVEESNLPVHISKLRRLLSETRGCRYIETVQGTGYRFVAPLQMVAESDWRAATAVSGGTYTVESTLGRHFEHSIAVLPLQNEAGDPDLEYLADGLTEGLINALSHTPNLKVIARETSFRYKTNRIGLKEIGEELKISKLLTGRIRLQGDGLVVGAELIDTLDGSQVWGNKYRTPFSEIINIQPDIVNELTATIFRRGPMRPPPTNNAESYKHYLMGRYLLAKRTTPEVRKAIEFFRKSVASCPLNVHAHAAIGDGYHWLYVIDRINRDEALRNIQPVLTTLEHLEQAVDVVQLLYGKLALTVDWDYQSAESHVRRALVLNPNLVEAHALYAEIMILCGKFAAARKHTLQVLSLDPISLFSFKNAGRLFYKLGQYSDAVACLQDAQEMESFDFETLLLMGANLAELGDYDRALQVLNQSFLSHANIETLSMIGYVEALAGRTKNAGDVVARIKSELREHNSHALNLARIYLAMGEKNLAYRLLDKAYEQRAVDLYGLCFDPRWRVIKGEQRFKMLVRKVRNVTSLLE